MLYNLVNVIIFELNRAGRFSLKDILCKCIKMVFIFMNVKNYIVYLVQFYLIFLTQFVVILVVVAVLLSFTEFTSKYLVYNIYEYAFFHLNLRKKNNFLIGRSK